MKKESKRIITPYKGGRTAQIPMRFTPEEKAALQAAAASAGMSMSDFVLMLLQGIRAKTMPLLIQNYKVIGDNNDYLVTTVNGIVVIIQHRIHDNTLFNDLFVSGVGTLKIGEPLSDELKEALGNDLIPNLYLDENNYEYNVTIHVEISED